MSPTPKRAVVIGANRPTTSPLAPPAAVAPASAWAAAPTAATAACDATLALHPISCLLSNSPVRLEIALTFSTTCTGGEGVTYFVLQNLFGQTGISATFEVTPTAPETQVFDINLGGPGNPPATFHASGVIAYPDGSQAFKDYEFTTPVNRCCFQPTT